MPRPRQAKGRPGTRVIPKNWESNHSVVVAKTWTATVTIWPPNGGDDVVIDRETLEVTATPGEAIATDQPARIQELNAQEARAVVGDQEQVTNGYLVVVDRDLVVPVNAIVAVTACSDGSLVGRSLKVSRVGKGSLTWERDLYCAEDQTDTNT